MENAKKFAREISELKTKLAEKDAKLAGGFGAPFLSCWPRRRRRGV